MDSIRDWNVVRSNNEKLGGNNVPIRVLKEFNEVINSLALTDIPVINGSYTWCNNRRVAKRIYVQLDHAMVELENSQIALSSNPLCEDSIQREVDARQGYESTLSNEAILLSQKSRLKWTKEQDRCSKYFYQKIKDRRYYIELFSSKGQTSIPLAVYLRKTLNCEDAAVLEVLITREEVKRTIFSMGIDKALGPYGFTVHFFRVYWDIIRVEVANAVMKFFNYPTLGKGLNSTFITLVPKVKEATKVEEFIPISLCNVLYKIITKILADRLGSVLHKIVGKEQNAFVVGMKIQDNLILASELLKGWIKACITSVWFSILVNGSLCGFFQPSRARKSNLIVSDQFFADDLLVVVKANMASVLTLRRIMQNFEDSFGLPISNKGLKRIDCKPLLDKASVFILPSTVINVLKRRMINFVWGHEDSTVKLYGLCWKKITAPKQEGVLTGITYREGEFLLLLDVVCMKIMRNQLIMFLSIVVILGRGPHVVTLSDSDISDNEDNEVHDEQVQEAEKDDEILKKMVEETIEVKQTINKLVKKLI
ncbi:uncharacterized protein LOC132277859 [Cornus florida]|uniref:uncharacterized protein LOC132277859 n=1 Tax=Cornus florida TaxID=4283 RepID=UPI00289E07FD|nr:uncharacterized protein LOC132277859 [Cornus florida]